MNGSPRRDFVKLFREIAQHRHLYRVFHDFVEMAATAIRKTTVPPDQGEALEARYMEIVKANEVAAVRRMPELMAHLVRGLSDGGEDFLGQVAGELEVLNKHSGQFFTPWNLSEMMARMVLGHGIKAAVETNGFLSVCEPAVGAGGMVLAVAKVFREEGFDPSTQLFVHATDIDSMAFNMTYLQLSIARIPAFVYRGDSLSGEMREVGRTPAFFSFYEAKRAAFDKWWHSPPPAVEQPATPAPMVEPVLPQKGTKKVPNRRPQGALEQHTLF